jgi:hypothetical protein
MKRFRPFGGYEIRPTAAGPPGPEAIVNVTVMFLEYAALRRLAARLRREGAAGDRRRLRRGLVRILGRETLELIEAGGTARASRCG